MPSYGSRSFWNKGCATKHRFSLQRGIITKLREDYIVSELILNTEKCKIQHGHCIDPNATVIWTVPEHNRNCEYRHSGPFRGILSRDIILIDSLDSAFIFKNESVIDQQLSCFNVTPFVTTTKVLLTFPNLPPIPSISIMMKHLAQMEVQKQQRKKRSIEEGPVIIEFEREYQNFIAYPYLRRTLDPLGSIELYKKYVIRRANIPSYTVDRLFRFDPMMTARLRHLNVSHDHVRNLVKQWDYVDVNLAVIHAFALKEMEIVTNQAIQIIPTDELIRQVGQRILAVDFIAQAEKRQSSMIAFLRDLALEFSLTPARLWNNDYVPSQTDILSAFFPPLVYSLRTSAMSRKQLEVAEKLMTTITKIVQDGGATASSINAENEYIERVLHQNENVTFFKNLAKLPHYPTLFYNREAKYGLKVPKSFYDESYEIIVPSTSQEHQMRKYFIEAKMKDLKVAPITLAPQPLVQTTSRPRPPPVRLEQRHEVARPQSIPTPWTTTLPPVKITQGPIPYAIRLVEKELDSERNIAMNRQRTAMHYGFQSMRKDLISEFHRVYEHICHTQNEFIKHWQAILRINPTVGIRSLLQRNDISAHFVNRDILNIHTCVPIEVEHIYNNHTYEGKCYMDTPVKAKTGKLYFAFPGSLDLQQSGIKIDCGRVIPNV
ncbi:unnamed protein product, partial [Auanema sp. JU1783]